MRVRQYVYFLVRSDSVRPPDTTAAIGIEPDEVRRRGSRRPGPPPVPRTNLWMVKSGRPDTVDLDEHFDALLARLLPHQERIRAFLASAGADADADAAGTIEVVRRFEPGPEDDELLATPGLPEGLVRLRGQHPLVGFTLDRRLLAFATRTGVTFDFDEYGDEYE